MLFENVPHTNMPSPFVQDEAPDDGLDARTFLPHQLRLGLWNKLGRITGRYSVAFAGLLVMSLVNVESPSQYKEHVLSSDNELEVVEP
jgi:hypothetical protein